MNYSRNCHRSYDTLDYLTHCRFEKQSSCFKESGKSVPEVSEAIGYPAHETLSKLFKKKKLAKLLARTEKKILKGVK